ncbi:MAG: haloacid dehalogenase, partial [Dehalococcoidia bacterium]
MVTATHQSTAADQPLRGLGASEAAERRAAGAVNGTRHTVSRSYVRIIGQNLFTFLNLLIFAISGVLAALGLYLDALFAGILGTLNALIAIVQEVRAKRTLDRIAVLTRPQAVVIRDGREQTVTAADVVRDDLVVVRSGDQVVADGPIVTATGVTVDESLLTGEAELVSKAAGDLLYSGTYCMTGTAVYRADRVGADSTA